MIEKKIVLPEEYFDPCIDIKKCGPDKIKKETYCIHQRDKNW